VKLTVTQHDARGVVVTMDPSGMRADRVLVPWFSQDVPDPITAHDVPDPITAHDVPDPITAHDVAEMNLAEAQDAYRQLSQALQQARVDKETKKRLWDEWRQVRNRVRELKKSEEP
jgi:hypothetical protein